MRKLQLTPSSCKPVTSIRRRQTRSLDIPVYSHSTIQLLMTAQSKIPLPINYLKTFVFKEAYSLYQHTFDHIKGHSILAGKTKYSLKICVFCCLLRKKNQKIQQTMDIGQGLYRVLGSKLFSICVLSKGQRIIVTVISTKYWFAVQLFFIVHFPFF